MLLRDTKWSNHVTKTAANRRCNGFHLFQTCMYAYMNVYESVLCWNEKVPSPSESMPGLEEYGCRAKHAAHQSEGHGNVGPASRSGRLELASGVECSLGCLLSHDNRAGESLHNEVPGLRCLSSGHGDGHRAEEGVGGASSSYSERHCDNITGDGRLRHTGCWHYHHHGARDMRRDDAAALGEHGRGGHDLGDRDPRDVALRSRSCSRGQVGIHRSTGTACLLLSSRRARRRTIIASIGVSVASSSGVTGRTRAASGSSVAGVTSVAGTANYDSATCTAL